MDIFYIIAVGLILDHICPSKQGPALCQGTHGGGGTGDCQVEALGGRGAVPLERVWVVKELGGVRYQRITRAKQLVFTRLMQIQIWHWC